jgi:hypothetical protein
MLEIFLLLLLAGGVMLLAVYITVQLFIFKDKNDKR